MNKRGDMDQAPSASSAANGTMLPHRIEFHLAKKSFSFTDAANFKLQNSSAANTSQPFLANTENGLESDIRFRIAVRRIGAGLENLGNTCFLNSVLQCLTYTEPLVAYFQSGKHQNSCHVVGFCALCAIQKHVTRALQSTGRILAPKDLVSNLRRISRNFRNSRQEDAHEYMVNLLESMHKCCLPSGVPSESPNAYEKSLVHKIFGGCLRSQVKCMQCSYCSNKFDPFLDLSLEIMKADSVYKALAHFTAPEQLDGGERQYQCQQCKQKVRALKQLTVHKAPYVLTIHLKRFGSHISGQKIDKKVHFSPTLNFKPFVSGSYEGDLKYTLYGVLVHAGWSTHSGHYFCFVRTSSGMWYSLDDNRVVQVSERTVFEQKAYMLFYVRDAKNSTPVKPDTTSQNAKPVTNVIQNRFSSTSTTTSDGFCNRLSVKSVQDEKTATTMQNGFCTPSSILPKISKKSSEENVGENIQEDISGMKVIVSDDPVQSNMQCSGLPSVVKTLYDKQSGYKSGGTVLPQPFSKDKNTSSVCRSTCTALSQSSSDKKDKGPTSVHEKNDTPFLQPSTERKEKEIVCESKKDSVALLNGSSKVKRDGTDPYLSATKSSANEPDIAADRLFQHSQKGGSLSEEVVASQATDGMSQRPQTSNVPPTANGLLVKASNNSSEPQTSNVPVTANGSLVKASNNCSALKAKKFLKCKVLSIHLGTRLLYGGLLSLQRRKKHKKVKKKNQKLVVKTPRGEDMGPSTSHFTTALAEGGSKHAIKKKCEKLLSKKVDATRSDLAINGILNANDIDVEFQKRIIWGNTTQNAGDQPRDCIEISTTLKRERNEEFTCQKSGENLLQNGFTDATFRCFQTAVAQWGGVDGANSNIVNPTASESIAIGYVPDEWDEEYDRGRRKKVKVTKVGFDGPNPFQEIASRKASEMKRMKRKPYKFTNQPFRI